MGRRQGVLRLIAGTNPAANTELSETVPANTYWRLLSVSVSLAQGATQTPQPILVVDNGTTVAYENFGSSAAQAVSTTCQYTWAPDLTLSGQVGTGTNVHSTASLPKTLVLGPGWRVRTVTLGIGANSDYGAPALFVVAYDIHPDV